MGCGKEGETMTLGSCEDVAAVTFQKERISDPDKNYRCKLGEMDLIASMG